MKPPAKLARHSVALLHLAWIFLMSISTTHAVQLFSFESGLEGWEVSGFNSQPVSLATSFFGATAGVQSLRITQTGQGFSYDAKRFDIPGQNPFYDAMNLAAVDESLWTLELDVTYRDVDIPNGNFLNMTFWINSTNGFRNFQPSEFTNTVEDRTVHLSIPLTSFSGTDELAANSPYYEMGIGLNGDWGVGNATIYVDNIQLVPEPSSSLLVGLGCAAMTLLRRIRTLDPSPTRTLFHRRKEGKGRQGRGRF